MHEHNRTFHLLLFLALCFSFAQQMSFGKILSMFHFVFPSLSLSLSASTSPALSLQMKIAYRTHNYLLILRFSEKPKTFQGIAVWNVQRIFSLSSLSLCVCARGYIYLCLFILIPFYFAVAHKIRTFR